MNSFVLIYWDSSARHENNQCPLINDHIGSTLRLSKYYIIIFFLRRQVINHKAEDYPFLKFSWLSMEYIVFVVKMINKKLAVKE